MILQKIHKEKFYLVYYYRKKKATDVEKKLHSYELEYIEYTSNN